MLKKDAPSGKRSGNGHEVGDNVAKAPEPAGVPGEAARAVAEPAGTNGLADARSPDVHEDAAVLSENARVILEKRYLIKDEQGRPKETPEGLFRRVARAIAQGEEEGLRRLWEERFYGLLSSLKFLPNSPTLVNAGTDRGCLSACFVVSPEDTMDSIMEVAHDAAMIEKWGGGIGFGFSKLRPRNDQISTTHGEACGPIAVMKLYSSVGATLTQGAFRLGAHMGQLRDSHPDVREFIHCKDGDDTLQNFNISVQITDEFMRAIENDDDWALVNPRNGETVSSVRASELWDEIAESAWKTGDPGVVFIDRVWETAPNPQMGRIETSNPCGEEFLEDHGNCCLGSINLDRHVGDGDFDWEGLERTVRTSVRFLDDVINVNSFPLQSLRDVNLATRRIGLGVMGFADALVRLGVPYDSDRALELTDRLAGFIKDTAWDESRLLAGERGPFPEYERSALKERGMAPVRNSSVITIAPTGTISRIAGCSSGVEPHFAAAWWSNVLWKNHESSSSRLLGHAGVRAGDAGPGAWRRPGGRGAGADSGPAGRGPPPSWRSTGSTTRSTGRLWPSARRPTSACRRRGSGTSPTPSPRPSTCPTAPPWTTSGRLSGWAWETECKAVTVYRDGSKSMQVLETGGEEAREPEEHLLVPRQRPTTVRGVTGARPDRPRDHVRNDQLRRPTAIRSRSSPRRASRGGCDSANIDAISRLISLALRSGVDPDQIVEQLKGITCDPVWDGGTLVRSPADAVSLALSRHLGEERQPALREARAEYRSTVQMGLFPSAGGRPARPNGNVNPAMASGARCPQCSGYLVHQEGCLRCLDCGHTKLRIAHGLRRPGCDGGSGDRAIAFRQV